MDIGFQSMATENKVVIELQGSLPDTSDDTSPSKLSKRKKVVDLFCRHKLVVSMLLDTNVVVQLRASSRSSLPMELNCIVHAQKIFCMLQINQSDVRMKHYD